MANQGSWFGLPDFGVTEWLAKKASGGGTTDLSRAITGAYGTPPAQAQDYSSLRSSNQDQGFIGPTYSGPQNNQQYSAPPGDGGNGVPQNNFSQPPIDLSGERERTQSSENSALQAALGTFETRKQGLLGRIPGLEEQLALRLQGLGQGLDQFKQTAGREEGSRLESLGQTRGGVDEEYTRAGRQTRKSAQSLSRQLRNLFAGAGTLDSTQYRDYNIEQSRDIAQSIGDIGREKAGKMTAIGTEEEDVKQFYSEKRMQEEQRVTLAKEKARADTQGLVQGVMEDVNLTDSQKVEAVVEAQNRLSERMGQLDMMEVELKESRRKEDQEMSFKMAELSQKQSGAGYTQTINQQKALKDATAVVSSYAQRYNATPEQVQEFAKQVFSQYGIDEEYSNFFNVAPYRSGSTTSTGGQDFGTGFSTGGAG